jgi:hypothetical protein
MSRKRWQDLTPRARRLIVVAGSIEGMLKVAALVDLRRRPTAELRGSKPWWAAALVLVNSGGAVPIVYLIWGRRAPRPH